MPRKTPVKLALVDDHNLFRKGLITLIGLADKHEQYMIVFEAESGEAMMNKLDKKMLPDIILMDIDMPDMNGYDAVAWLKQHYPEIAVLVVSMVETEEAVVRMVRMGVRGYLSKDIEVEDIYHALREIREKGRYFTDFLTGKLIDAVNNDGEEDDNSNPIWSQLAEHERQFISLACTDMTYEEVAKKMFVSPKTVDGYRHSIFTRFKIKNRVGLVLFAIRNKLVEIN
jgi:two-component system invasion response regulator UvrY